jgi:hypothetical protein
MRILDTHGITFSTSNLVYMGESGALNEAYVVKCFLFIVANLKTAPYHCLFYVSPVLMSLLALAHIPLVQNQRYIWGDSGAHRPA